VKVAVALALGLGTMVGWKRIVVTVGERIGKEHLTYAQGASAELVAMGLIQAADMYHLPVSTRTCSLPAWPARWRRTARACNGPRCAIC
jgi:phosphate/sulfate permease